VDDDDEDDDDDDDDDDDMDITCLVLRYGTQDTKPIIRNVDGLLVPPASSPQPMGEGRGEVAAGETLLGEAGADATTATTTGTARTIAVVDAAVGAAVVGEAVGAEAVGEAVEEAVDMTRVLCMCDTFIMWFICHSDN
jgi:hypothetical protein